MRRAARDVERPTVTALTLLLNPTADKRTFRLPAPRMPIRVLLDTDAPEAAERDLDAESIEVAARSAMLIKAFIRYPS